MPSSEKLVARVTFHTRLRWLGVAFFFVAAVLLAGGVGAIATGQVGLKILPWCLLALGTSLGSFGTNDDTALALLAELGRRGQLPDAYRAEFAAEHKVRGPRISTLHDHPKAALILPTVAVLAICGAAFRVGSAWGLLS
jgi:hypothetical protein